MEILNTQNGREQMKQANSRQEKLKENSPYQMKTRQSG